MKKNFEKPVSEQIYQYLIDMILSLKIKPGDRIPEAAIAKQFEISRTPIREALRDLAKDGIINVYPKRFSEVAIYDEDKVKEIGITRICLDSLSFKLALYYGSRADFERLRVYANRCYEMAIKNDILHRIKSDSDFHWELCKMSKNRSLMNIQKSLLIQIEYLQAANYLQAEDPKTQFESHIRIVEALENGDLNLGLTEIIEPIIRFYNLKEIPESLYK